MKLHFSKMRSFNLKGLRRKTQVKLMSLINQNSNDVVLKQSGLWASAVTWTLMGGTFIGILWLATAETEEIVVASGKLEPISGVIDVQMPIQGVVKTIKVKEGEFVRKGQVLIQLDTEASKEKMKRTREILELKRREMNFKKDELHKTQVLSKSKIDSLEKSRMLASTIVNKYAQLQLQGATSELQLLDAKEKLRRIASDIETTKLESERQVIVLEQNLRNIKGQIAELQSSITEANVTLKYQEILSPVSGVVFDLKALTPGFVARSTEPILKVVPGDNLQANVDVESRNIGFISLGMPADISIDSFPASDFGVVSGKVKLIGSDALGPEPAKNKGYRFPTIIQLESQKLKLKNGTELPLQAGMSMTANIKLRKVTYLQLLLGTFKEKADSLRQI